MNEVACVLFLALIILNRLIFLFALPEQRSPLPRKMTWMFVTVDGISSLALKSCKEVEMGVYVTWRHFYYICHHKAVKSNLFQITRAKSM